MFKRTPFFQDGNQNAEFSIATPLKVNIYGVERGSEAEQISLAKSAPYVNWFVGACRTRVQLSELPFFRQYARNNDIDAIYTYSYGAEQIDVAVKYEQKSVEKEPVSVDYGGSITFENVNLVRDDNLEVRVNGALLATLDFSYDDENTTYIFVFGAGGGVSLSENSVVRGVFTYPFSVINVGTNTLQLTAVVDNGAGTFGIASGVFTVPQGDQTQTSSFSFAYDASVQGRPTQDFAFTV